MRAELVKGSRAYLVTRPGAAAAVLLRKSDFRLTYVALIGGMRAAAVDEELDDWDGIPLSMSETSDEDIVQVCVVLFFERMFFFSRCSISPLVVFLSFFCGFVHVSKSKDP